MRRINTTNKAIDAFGPGKHGWKNGVPGTGNRPTEGQAEWFNAVQEELSGVVEATGDALDGNNNAQLLKAIRVLRYVVNIKDFGAKVDGVTDDTEAIQTAVDSGAKVVLFPDGSTLISETITTPLGVRLRLAGSGHGSINNGSSGSVILKAATLNGPALDIRGDATSVEDLTFQGVAGNGGDGVLVRASRVHLRSVAAFLMGRDGFRIGTDAGGENCNLWKLDNVKAKNNVRHGIHVSEGAGPLADANGGTLFHADCQNNGGDGAYFNGAQLNTIIGGAFQSNGVCGVHFSQYVKYTMMFGGDVESNTGFQVRVDNGAEFNALYVYTLTYSQFSIAATTANNRIECIDHNRVISGISFPPTQIPSTDANTLDDYAEESFTPVLRDAATGNAAAATTAVGRCTKIGRRVFLDITLTGINTAGLTAGNQAVITGLPYAAANAGASAVGNVIRTNVAATTGSVSAAIAPNAVILTLVDNTTTGVVALLVSAITSGSGALNVTISYEASQ